MELKTVTHLSPAWEDKANFIVGVRCFDDNGLAIAQEQIWARQISDLTYEVCCIPFFAYNVSLADIVETDSEYWVRKVLKSSGHLTFRVWFDVPGDKKSQGREDVLQYVRQAGFLVEWHTTRLLAVDMPSRDKAQHFSGFLLEKESLGELTYETGESYSGRGL